MKTDPFIHLMALVERAKSFGYKALSTGVRLFGHVSHVAPDAWFHVVYPGLDETQLLELETRLGRTLPTSYRDFLRVANGISLYSGSLTLDGLRTSYVREGAWQPFALELANTVERPKATPETHVCIGGYRYDGSRLVIDSESGKVFRCPRRSAALILNEWPGFWEMLQAETERLASYFDPQGRRINTDPITPA